MNFLHYEFDLRTGDVVEVTLDKQANVCLLDSTCVFVIVTVIAYLASFTFGLLWWQKRSSMKSVASIVRNRSDSEGTQESGTDEVIDNASA